MVALKNQDSALDKLSNAAIEQRLGDISGLPKDLIECIEKVYLEFIVGYLNILRQKESKPVDWIPDTLVIDSELADGMRHFFSDHQHITREFFELNKKMDRLQEIDKDSQANLYHHAINEITGCFNQKIDSGEDNELIG
jgi:hypothetical protein